MIRLVIKPSVVTVVSPVLLYYGVAWAVLRCAHQEVHPDHAVAVDDFSSDGVGNSLASPSLPGVDLDCTDGDYHLESLAGPSTSSELLRALRDTVPHSKATLAAPSHARETEPDLGMKVWFNRISWPLSSTDPPRILSLSVLRL